MKSSIQNALMTKVNLRGSCGSGLKPEKQSDQPVRLTFMLSVTIKKPAFTADKPKTSAYLTASFYKLTIAHGNDATLMLQHPDGMTRWTWPSVGLTPISIVTMDEGVKTPSDADSLAAYTDAFLLDGFGYLLATPNLTVDSNALLKNLLKVLITRAFWLKLVENNLKVDCKLNLLEPIPILGTVSDLFITGSTKNQFSFDKTFELRLEVCDIISLKCKF